MLLKKLVVGYLDSNCYIVASEPGSEAIVIDPGGDAQHIFEAIAADDLDVRYIIITHAHWDHFGAASELSKRTGAAIAVHKLDKDALDNPKLNLAFMLGDEQDERISDVTELNDGDVIKFGALEALTLHTPGHSPGSITVRVDNCLFTGDLLFYGSIGRTDFPGGSYERLLNSVKEKIFIYPDEIKIYPGHGPSTSVGVERRENPFFN